MHLIAPKSYYKGIELNRKLLYFTTYIYRTFTSKHILFLEGEPFFSWNFFHFVNSNYCDSFCLKYNSISLILVTQRGKKLVRRHKKINAFHLLSSLYNSQFMCTTAPAALCKCAISLMAL